MKHANICHSILDAVKTIENTTKNKNLNEQELTECVYYLAKAVDSLLESEENKYKHKA
jgi:type VI protein secretion system component VasF